jgi:hypothetical protein
MRRWLLYLVHMARIRRRRVASRRRPLNDSRQAKVFFSEEKAEPALREAKDFYFGRLRIVGGAEK